MIKYTTPTITLTIKGADITSYNAFVTIEQGASKLTKSGGDLTMEAVTVGERTDTKITLELSQTETALFKEGQRARVQVNWTTGDGTRGATKIKGVGVLGNLLNEVI